MEKSKVLQSGYIEKIDNKTYIFTYDGELLWLVPKEKSTIKPYDYFQHKDMDISVMEATSVKGNYIFFLNAKLKRNGVGYIAKPAGYICFEQDIIEYDSIVFKGKAINYFYRPNNIIDTDSTKYDNEDGSKNIKLKPFKETIIENNVIIDKKEAEMILGILPPEEGIWMREEYTLGKPESILQLKFNKLLESKDFEKIYVYIYRLFEFLNFRKNVSLGDIYLLKDGYKIAEVYLSNKKDYESVHVDNTMGYFLINDKIGQLLEIINEEKINLTFIPNTRRESAVVDTQKYIMCCTSFESVFNYVFPDAKMEEQKKANEVKEEFLKYIEERREAYKKKDGKKRKEFKKYSDIIKLLDFGLEEKINYCINKYKDYIDEYVISKYINISKEENKTMVSDFVKKRNLLTHSSSVKLEDRDIKVYIIVRVLIYIMILDKAEVDKNLIKQAVVNIL
ncbi:MAG: hypothetical protein E7214_13400 [Clostridium sp.]|nr:hypothetical protein [Clostridium sp.]